MSEKTENQLGFSFFSPVSEENKAGCSDEGQMDGRLTTLLPRTQAALLEASSDEIDQELLPLLELCESVLTRVLDVAQYREATGWSPEEHRSLRGIGQTQWLLIEARTKDATASALKKNDG